MSATAINTVTTRYPTRLPDWPLRLEHFFAVRAPMPFSWGRNDCALFAADAVQAMTECDPAPAGLRGHTTAKQAYRALDRHHGLAAIATGALGEPIHPLRATVGDIVLLQVQGRDALAVCNGTTALMPSAHGVVSVSMEDASMAWRVA